MLLVYSHSISPRLTYICEFIFLEQLSLPFTITQLQDEFIRFKGPKINYSIDHLADDEFNHIQIHPHSLLFEKELTQQDIRVEEKDGIPFFFRTNDSAFQFDILAASFYLISRYEEYLSHPLDEYGRFNHTHAVAYKNGFLKRPVVNEWIHLLLKKLHSQFPSLVFKKTSFRFLPTYDIDIAYSFKGKGFLRNWGGFLKKPELKRIAVWMGKVKDPFDSYEWLDRVHQQKKDLNPIYFFLVAPKRGLYDKNLPIHSRIFQSLIKSVSFNYETGLHPSWNSYQNESMIKQEKHILETISNRKILISRQHYIRMNLPESYKVLIQAGIQADYSMGYGTINGFRASVASSFLWYNLKEEKVTNLRIFPFCFMDANSFYEQKQDPFETEKELIYYYQTCQKSNGIFISIFHNHILGTHSEFKGWREMYERFISQVQ